MAISESILDQVMSSMTWYDRAAKKARLLFVSHKMVEVIAGASIPLIVAFGWSPSITAVLGAMIAVLAGLDQLFRFQENWLNYRATCETIRSELLLYRAGAGPYGNPSQPEGPERLLVTRVSDVTARESVRWRDLTEGAAIPVAAGE